jgi:hypothetical protein
MKKAFYLLFSAIIFLGLITTTSCEKEEEPAALEVETAAFSVADYGLWYYFSFEEGEVIGTGSAKPSDPDDAAWKARGDWDLAFHRQDVRTNSGTSGNGQGGALEAASATLSTITEAPSSGYVVDDSISILPAFAMPPTYVNSAGNTVVSNWAVFSHAEGWSIADKAFVVKTADGKYAKIKLVNFLDEDDASGFVTMEYVYQPDGTTRLE